MSNEIDENDFDLRFHNTKSISLWLFGPYTQWWVWGWGARGKTKKGAPLMTPSFSANRDKHFDQA